jgi:tryptophan synthase alpha chain
MSRLEEVFARAKSRGRAAFIAYVMAGDPDLETTLSILDALTAAGTDLIELGVPYGDPLADGPTIAAAAHRALANGTRLHHVFELVRRYCDGDGAPVVLFSYFNPIFRYGIERFARESAEAGARGLIVPDLALEETAELRASAGVHDLQMPLLIAPSTRPQRAAQIAGAAGGFVYVVSRLGVTGASGAPNVEQVRRQIATMRELTTKPLAVGFGLSQPQDVRAVASFADGVIVGSALIDAYRGQTGVESARSVGAFVEPLITATAWAGSVTHS